MDGRGRLPMHERVALPGVRTGNRRAGPRHCWVYETADGILHTPTTYCHRISDLGALGGQELSMWVTGAIAREALGFYWRA